MKLFPTVAAHGLVREEEEQRWLVEDLWGEGAVGIVGGEPKCCKSFLALDLAVSVASGRPCLGRFPARRAGRVLLFAAEDALSIVRSRLDGIALARGMTLEDLDVHVITAPTVRLDLAPDRERLRNTVAELHPRLLVLDPFVRLHRVDENASGEVAPLLAYLRELNREHDLAVALVHHARKGGSGRAGQALRGSSEFHAWGDSNLYLRRRGDALELCAEHRAAPALGPIQLELSVEPAGLSLGIAQTLAPIEPVIRSAKERILEALEAGSGPTKMAELRQGCRMRTQTLVRELQALVEAGTVERAAGGYRLRKEP